MHIEDNLETLEQLLNEQIGKVATKGDISPSELENMTKTLCLLEKIKDYTEDKAWEVEEDGYSQAPRRYVRKVYNDAHGTSHRTSRYSRRAPYRMPYDGGDPYYDRGGYGYSGHSIKDRMIAKLESMYDEAKSDHERQIVDEWIDRLTTE